MAETKSRISQVSSGIDWAAAGAEGSIAHMLSERPGGVDGAFKRIEAAVGAGTEPWAALRQELGEKDSTPAGPDPVAGIHDLLDRIQQLAMDCPVDGMRPGYELTPESRQECARAISLLQEAERLVARCTAREEPRYQACPDA